MYNDSHTALCWVTLFTIFVSSTAGAEETVLPASPSREKPALHSPKAIDGQLAIPTLGKPRALFHHSSYPAAWTAAQQSNRPILVYVSMSNCPHCDKMMEKTYGQSNIHQLVTGSFETIRADRRSHAKLISSLKVKWYPTTVLVGPNNKVLDVIEGYVDSKRFQHRLQTGLASNKAGTQTR